MPTLLRRGARYLLPLLLVIAIPIVVLAAYDVTGVSDPEPFGVGSLPTQTSTPAIAATSTASPTATATATSTATATETATPRACGAVADASLEFRPDEIKRDGDGPFDVVLKLRNSGSQSYAVDVVLALDTTKGATYLDRVDLPGGATWAIGGAPGSATLAIGDIAPRGEVSVALRIHMLASWTAAEDLEAKIRVSIHSALCLRHPSLARATITLERDDDKHGHHGIAEDAPLQSDTPDSADETSTASATVTPSSPAGDESATPAPTNTMAAEPTATSTPSPTPEESQEDPP
ncbi:MAG: hypothetical protein WEB52_05895 [Dehalococcoidia bacterium]